MYRKTIGKRMAAKLKDVRQQLRQRRHGRIGDTVAWVISVVRGISNITRFQTTRSD